MLGFLISHEMLIGEDQRKKIKKRTALKATTEYEKELDDDDIVLLTRKLNQFFNKNSRGKRGELCTQKESFNCFIALSNEVTIFKFTIR